MSEIKLLPCPFCGGEAKYKKHYREDIYHGYLPVMKCESCGAIASLTDSDIGNYEEILTRKWNTRKPMQDIVERLEDLKQHNLNEAKKCSEFENFQVYMNDNRGFYRDNAKCYEVAIGVVKEVGGMNE